MQTKDNTLILVDYDNVFVTLNNLYKNFKHPNIMYDIITKIRKQYKHDNILSIKLFADFQKVKISDEGYNILKQNHVELEHVFNGKNASDVILMINCIKYLMQYPHINKIVLISSDSDLVPIFHEVQLLNKKLEVLYFKANTSLEHIKHIEEIGVNNTTIENLLGIDVYRECTSKEDFYKYKTSNKEDFNQLLQLINDIILENYNKYKKTDENNNITSVGATSLSTLSTALKEKSVCSDKEFWKSSSDTYTNILDLLMDYNILIKHEYADNANKKFNTLILNEDYLISNNYTINNLLKMENFL